MRPLRFLLRRARDQRGVTLPELLVAMMIGLGTSLAVFALLDTSVKQSNAIAGRVNATQRARLAMDTITRELRSQVCNSVGTAVEVPALITATDDSVTFHGDLSDGTRPIEKREITYDPATKKLTERTWNGVVNPLVGGPVLFPLLTRTRMLADDVVKRPANPLPGPDLPIFRYWKYDTAVPPRPSVRINAPLTTEDMRWVAKIDIGFVTRPPAAKTNRSAQVTLENEIYVRIANPNVIRAPDPTPRPICA
jgi:prepilin-type N-terminal cleavage/methylation domain-containing protein